MALTLNDRVLETCTSPGTGAVTLLGATTGFRTFLAGVGNGNTCYYTIADQSGGSWEVGLGTYTSSSNTLARTTILSSSNSGSLVNFNSGTQNVFVTYPAEKAVYLDASGNVTISGNLTLTNSITTGGHYSQGAFSGTYTDGIVLDYVTGTGRISVGSSDGLSIYNGGVGGTALLNLDSSGNLGLGLTPSAWGSGYKVFQVGSTGSFYNDGIGTTYAANNFYVSSSGTKYLTSSYATAYGQTASGEHRFYNAPSGTAGSAISFTQAMTLTAAGYLGIGTTNPSTNLHVYGGPINVSGTSGVYYQTGSYDAIKNASGVLAFGGVTAAQWDTVALYTSGTEKMRLTSAGYLGIGTSSPTSRLHLAGNGTAAGITLQNDSSAIANSVIRWQNNAGTYQAGIASYFNIADTGNLEFLNGSTTNMVLNSSGNLGLGVTPSGWNTGKAFEMGGGSVYTDSGNNELSIAQGAYNNSGWKYKYTGVAAGLASNYQGTHIWYTAPSGTAGSAISFTQAMTLDASGNLGIGTTSPAAKFEAVISGAARLLIGYAGGSANYFDANDNIFRSGSGTERARIDSSGNFLVGTTSTLLSGPTCQVVTGTTTPFAGRHSATSAGKYWFFGPNNGNNYVVQNQGSVGVYITDGATSWTGTSDSRLKNITGKIENALEAVATLTPARFTWTTHDQDKPQVGLIAQEVQKVLPEVVDINSEGYLGIKYAEVMPLLVAAIQELHAELQELKATLH